MSDFFTSLIGNPDAVIIANGNYPTHEIPLSYIEKATYIVCCDGAANGFIARGGHPNAIVGDCDSISEENKIRFADIIHPDPDQFTNDLTKSVQFCAQQGMKNLIIVAATGKSEDHALGNISLLAEYMYYSNVVMITDYGIIFPIHSPTTFPSFRGQRISFFCIDRAEVTLHGLRYPLDKAILTNWWQGTLNESLGDAFSIETWGRTLVFCGYHPAPTSPASASL